MTGRGATDPWAARGEDSVLRRCARGDESAWELVHGFVLAVCRRACRSGPDSAEDLSSAVVLKMVQGGIRSVQSAAAFRSYLRKAALFAVIDSGRSARRREISIDQPRSSRDESTAPVEIPDPASSLEQGVLRRETRAIVRRILDNLSGECRKVLRAYFQYKMGVIEDYKELSRALGRPVGTISVQVGRCLQRFRKDPAAASLQD
jgi:RNA polymerase sigma factor (sigma-70 family)